MAVRLTVTDRAGGLQQGQVGGRLQPPQWPQHALDKPHQVVGPQGTRVLDTCRDGAQGSAVICGGQKGGGVRGPEYWIPAETGHRGQQ